MPGRPGLCSLARLILLLGAVSIFGTAACGAPPSATLPAPPQPIQAAYRPALQPLLPNLAACAANQPAITLFTQAEVRPLLEIEADLILYLGEDELPETTYTATLLGQEAIVVIVHASNPLDKLTDQELQAIYSGENSAWPGASSNGVIQVWTYASQDGARRSFEQAILGAIPLSSRAYLAPNPQAVLEAVAGDSQAIGYLPAAWLLTAAPSQTASIHAIRLNESLTSQLSLPILALTPGAPQGALRALLLCLQNFGN